MNWSRLASEVLRALRGKRSQPAFSRRLGYRSNVAYAWESGRAWPAASRFFQILEKLGHPADRTIERFYRQEPAWLGKAKLTRADGIALLLQDLRADRGILDLANACGRSRFRVARWLSGTTEPRLPDLLRMIEATSLRLLDFLATFVDPAKLPSVQDAWHRLLVSRRLAYDAPWSHAVLRVIELAAYRALDRHEPGWIARRLGITIEQESTCLALLAEAGQIRQEVGRWVLDETSTIDTRADPARARQLKTFWARVALDRLAAGADGLFSYNLFSVSSADLERIRQLHRNYFRELRSIVAASNPSETVALACISLLELRG